MLTAAVVLAALALALGAAALTLALLVWGGGFRAERFVPPMEDGEGEGKRFPLDDAKLQEGIANLLAYDGTGGKEGEE